MLIALVLAVTLSNANENDPSRTLTISNSALDPKSRLVFFAEFGEVPSNTFDFDVRVSVVMLSRFTMKICTYYVHTCISIPSVNVHTCIYIHT